MMIHKPSDIESHAVLIGTVGTPHGIKGAFVCFTSDRRHEEISYSELWVVISGTAKRYFVSGSYVSGGKPILALDGVGSRTEAEALFGALIYVDRKLLEVHDDEVLVADLIQTVVECPVGKRRGVVIGVHDFGAQTNIEIRLDRENSSGSEIQNDQTVLFPFLKQFIDSHDIQNKTIVVSNLDAFILQPGYESEADGEN